MKTACISRSSPSPARPESGTTSAPLTCGRSRVAFSRRSLQEALLVGDEIPFVEPDHNRPAFAFDQIDDGQILFLERNRGIEQNHHDIGESHGAQPVGCGELFQLVIDPRALAQTRRVDQLGGGARRQVPVDGDRIAGDPGPRAP